MKETRAHKKLSEMIQIFKPNGIDWMGYRMTEDNPYTFHHIVEKRDGGSLTIDNGAILTEKAHKKLNFYDLFCKEAYNEYQRLFKIINKSKAPIADEMYEEIYYLAYRIEVLNEFFYCYNDLMLAKKRERLEIKKMIDEEVWEYYNELNNMTSNKGDIFGLNGIKKFDDPNNILIKVLSKTH